jgi:hypothetical protein
MKQFQIGWAVGAAAFACTFAATAQSSWYASQWGANDEIGAANYMTAATALQAVKLVKTGKVYSLGITVSTTTPAFPPRTCSIYIVQPGQVGSAAGLGSTHTTYNDDILHCWNGIGTQIDGLGHIGVGELYYNGNKWGDFATMGGLKKLAPRRSRRWSRAASFSTWRGTWASTWSRKGRRSTRPRSMPSPPSKASRSARATSSSSTPAGSA